jgi:transposase-like protein
MDENLRSKAVGSPRGLVRCTARGRHYSPAARLAIVEESYATDAWVADMAALYGISCSQMHARRKKYDGRDGAGEDCRDLVSFAPVEIGEPISEAEPSAVADGGPGAGRMEIICPTGHRVVIGNGDWLEKRLNKAAH